MQHTHRLVHLAGHMLIDLPEGRFVVDTGSPGSFGDPGTATYGGVTCELPVAWNGIGLADLAGLGLDARIGQRLRGVLGMDLLGREPVLWDGPRGRAIVRPPAPPASTASIAMDLARVPGLPVVRARLGGRERRLLLDTGAQFGYLAARDDLAFGEDAGELDDFHPVLGAIRAPSARLRPELVRESGGVVRVRERFGFHAPLAEGALRALAVDGILGCAWLAAREAWFLPAEGRIAIA
jgi:hypothetical protein